MCIPPSEKLRQHRNRTPFLLPRCLLLLLGGLGGRHVAYNIFAPRVKLATAALKVPFELVAEYSGITLCTLLCKLLCYLQAAVAAIEHHAV